MDYEMEKQLFEEMGAMLTVCNAIIFHLDSIQESDDKDDIETHIACIKEIELNSPSLIRKTRCLRTAIRNGDGDFKKIQKKCINLGVV